MANSWAYSCKNCNPDITGKGIFPVDCCSKCIGIPDAKEPRTLHKVLGRANEVRELAADLRKQADSLDRIADNLIESVKHDLKLRNTP